MEAKTLCSLVGNTLFSQLEHDCIACTNESKITNAIEVINQKIVDVYTQIASTITFSKYSLVKAHYIAEAMLALGDAAGRKQDYEVSMFMLSNNNRDLSDGIYIDDIVVGKKQTVHPTLCDVSGEGVHLSEESAKDNNQCVLGWAHSHAKMPIFYSTIDNRQMNQLIQHKGWPVGLDVFDEEEPSMYARLYPALVVNGTQSLPSLRVVGEVPQLTYTAEGITVIEKRIDFEKPSSLLKDKACFPNLVVDASGKIFTEQDKQDVQQNLLREVTFNDGIHLGSIVEDTVDFTFNEPQYIEQYTLEQPQSSQLLRFKGDIFQNQYDSIKSEFEKRYGNSSTQSYGHKVGSLYMTSLQTDPLEKSIITQVSGVLSGLRVYDSKKQWKWSSRCKSIEHITSQYDKKLSLEEKNALISLSTNVLQHKYLTKHHKQLQVRVVHALTDLCCTYSHVTQRSA